MRRAATILLSVLIVLFSFNYTACAQELSLSAQAYVLYCVENDTVLLSKNENVKMKPASTTKIMTTLLALEQCEKEDVRVTFDTPMIAEGSSMYLKISDTVHLSDLASGMMMASGNDAANAVALTLCKDTDEFAKLMNKRAQAIGMKNTNFVTASGLDDENHYSTAYDMALLMDCAMKNESFAQITKNKSMTVDFLTPQKRVTYTNHNRLLTMYEHCIGGKTGYTKSAGRCLVSVARKDGLTLICVTLNASDDWNDHMKMYDYGFSQYCGVDTDDSNDKFTADIVGSDVDSIVVSCDKNDNKAIRACDKDRVVRKVYMPRFLYAPVIKGECVGFVKYTLDGTEIASNPVFAQENADIVKKR